MRFAPRVAGVFSRPALSGVLTVRFWLLMGLAEMCLTRGLAYNFVQDVRDNPPPGLSSLSHGWIQIFGVGWSLAAALCIYLAFSQRRNVWAMAYVGAPALVWALAYGVTWITTADASWVGAAFFQGLSAATYWAANIRPAGGWRA